jgi:hypothetical protein
MGSYSPGRPPNERDLQQAIAGQPVFLGVITSTAAAAVNNGTTSVPFNTKSPLPGKNFDGSLAGKVLLLQPTAAGLILPNPSTVTVPAAVTPIIAQQATVPNPPTVIPGVLLAQGERVEITMSQTTAYLDFVAVTGTASLLVWEMQ